MLCYPNFLNKNVIIRRNYEEKNEVNSIYQLETPNVTSNLSIQVEINQEEFNDRLISLLKGLLILSSLRSRNALDKAIQELENIIKLEDNKYFEDSSLVISQEISTFNIEKISVNSNFQITLNRLLELQEIDCDLDENDEDEIYLPSEYAFSASKNLLDELYKALGDAFPCGFSSLDSRGGINLIWRNQEFDKEVKVKVPFCKDLESYIYYYQGDNSKLKTITVNTAIDYISNLLRWLSNNNPITSV